MEKFIASGGRITADDWNVNIDNNRYVAGEGEDTEDENITFPVCCPLGAVLVAQDPRQWDGDNQTDAANVLGVTPGWVNSFVVGVDDGDTDSVLSHEYDDDAYQLGREFRTKYVRDE